METFRIEIYLMVFEENEIDAQVFATFPQTLVSQVNEARNKINLLQLRSFPLAEFPRLLCL